MGEDLKVRMSHLHSFHLNKNVERLLRSHSRVKLCTLPYMQMWVNSEALLFCINLLEVGAIDGELRATTYTMGAVSLRKLTGDLFY